MSINKSNLKGILIFFLIFFANQLFAQEQEKIEIIEKPLGTVFKFNGKFLNIEDITEITSSNSVSRNEMKIAKRNYYTMNFFSMVGGVLIGWPIGTLVGGGEPKWELAGVGAGFVIIAIPFQMGYSKHTKKAVNEFYSDNQVPLKSNQLNFAIKPNGVSFIYNF